MIQVAYAEMQLENARMIVEDERAGQVHFGKIGSIVEVNGSEVTLNFNPGVDCIDSSYLADLHEIKPLNKLQKMMGSLTAIVLKSCVQCN